MSRTKHNQRVSEAEKFYNNRSHGGWKAPGDGSLAYPAGNGGQQRFHGLDMWGKGIPGFLRDAAEPRPEAAGDGVSGLVTDTYLTAPRIICWEGGGLFQLTVPSRRPVLDLPERGEITTFSKGAARRLRYALAKILNSAWKTALLTTLTYPVDDIDLSDWHIYKVHLDRFSKAFRREYPDASAIWRLEFTERGFPHYHFVVFGIPDTEKALLDYRNWHQKIWFRVVGSGLEKHLKACGNAERVTSVEGARNYVAKYVSKQSAQCSGFTGRYWGRINSAMLPLAPLIETPISDYKAVISARVLRKVIEKQVNERRWNKAIGDCSKLGERGWTRLNHDYARTLQGKKGDAVRLVGESWEAKLFYKGKLRDHEGSTPAIWHHFFPTGMSCKDVVGDEEKGWVVSDKMTPRNLKVPRKFKHRKNSSVAYLGEHASRVAKDLGRYLDSVRERSEITFENFRRPKR